MGRQGVFVLVLAIGLTPGGLAGGTARVSAVGQPPPIEWLVFFDDLHLRFVDTGRLRQVVRTLHRELVHAGDQCVLVCSGPSCQPGGTDTFVGCGGLLEAARRIVGNGLREDDVVREAGSQPAGREVRWRANAALTAASSLLQRTAATPNAAHLLYISNGYPTAAGIDVRVAALADAAAARGVRVFAIDTRSVTFDAVRYPSLSEERWRAFHAETAASLAVLADRTGGLAVNAAAAPEDAVAEIQARVR